MSLFLISSLLFIGFLAGVLSGLFGIGGGIVITVALGWFGLDQKVISGTSLTALIPPVGLLAYMEYAKRQQVRLSWAMLLALGLLLGAFVGSKLTAPMSSETLRKLLGIFLIGVGIKYLF